MAVTTATWVWYNPLITKPLAYVSGSTAAQQATSKAAFWDSIVGTTIDRSGYTEQVAWVDGGGIATPDNRIDDLDPYAHLGASEGGNPPLGEGLGFGDPLNPASLVVRPLSTFATFRVQITLDNGTVLPDTYSLAAYQFTDGTVAYRFEDASIVSLTGEGITNKQIATILVTARGDFYTSVAPAGHNDPFPCYASGTMIQTERGLVAVEALAIGDRVLTETGSWATVRWTGARVVAFPADGSMDHLRPIRIQRSAIAPCTPNAQLLVSPQHRILVRSQIALRVHASERVLVPAKALLDHPGVEVAMDLAEVSYHHFMCDEHQVINAAGLWSETLYLGEQARQVLGAEQLAEILEIFPGLLSDIAPKAAAKLLPPGRSKQLVSRHMKNSVPVQGQAMAYSV